MSLRPSTSIYPRTLCAAAATAAHAGPPVAPPLSRPCPPPRPAPPRRARLSEPPAARAHLPHRRQHRLPLANLAVAASEPHPRLDPSIDSLGHVVPVPHRRRGGGGGGAPRRARRVDPLLGAQLLLGRCGRQTPQPRDAGGGNASSPRHVAMLLLPLRPPAPPPTPVPGAARRAVAGAPGRAPRRRFLPLPRRAHGADGPTPALPPPPRRAHGAGGPTPAVLPPPRPAGGGGLELVFVLGRPVRVLVCPWHPLVRQLAFVVVFPRPAGGRRRGRRLGELLGVVERRLAKLASARQGG